MALYAMCRRVWSKRGTGGSREPESFTLQKQERQYMSEDLTDAAWISKQSILSFLKLAMKTLYGVDLTWDIWTEKITVLFGTNEPNVGGCYWCWKQIYIFHFYLKYQNCRLSQVVAWCRRSAFSRKIALQPMQSKTWNISRPKSSHHSKQSGIRTPLGGIPWQMNLLVSKVTRRCVAVAEDGVLQQWLLLFANCKLQFVTEVVVQPPPVPVEEEQLLQVPTAARIPICRRSWMVEPMLVIIKVSKAMEATNSGLTKPMFDILGLGLGLTWNDVNTSYDADPSYDDFSHLTYFHPLKLK